MPTAKICAAIRCAARQGFKLSRTRPRRIAAWLLEQSSAHTNRLGTLCDMGVSKFWGPKCVPKTGTLVCASERRMSARPWLTSARQFVGSRAKGSHSVAQGRGASRRDASNKSARAPRTWHSLSQGRSIFLRAETCFQNCARCPRTVACPIEQSCKRIGSASTMPSFWCARCFLRLVTQRCVSALVEKPVPQFHRFTHLPNLGPKSLPACPHDIQSTEHCQA